MLYAPLQYNTFNQTLASKNTLSSLDKWNLIYFHRQHYFFDRANWKTMKKEEDSGVINHGS